MKHLFRISTNRFTLDWHRVRDTDPAILGNSVPVMGRLRLVPHDAGLEWRDLMMRSGVPNSLASDLDDPSGPPLYEQTEYQLYLRGANENDQVEIRHRDPVITRALSSQEDGRVVHGAVNFRGQIGRSLFSIYVNGQRTLDFEVEVFPTKVDYESDYQDIVADVQSILTNLAYEYLRSSHQLGKVSGDRSPSKLEWLVLIEQIIDELDVAMNHIAQRPTRGLVRRERSTRLERIRRVDSRVRSQVRRGQGKGALVQLAGVTAREQIVQRPAELTLDTMEHRWLRNQLIDVQRTLGQIASIYDSEQELSSRRKRTFAGITRLKARVSRLLGLEPIKEADGDPPTGFASLQLVSAPGYREAYRLLMFLKMGLRLEGDLIRLALKDLEVLYEYWTYLTVVRIIQDEHGPPQNLDSLFRLRSSGLSVQLRQGEMQQVAFSTGRHRTIRVKYNPQFSNQDTTLIPQKPDILIRFEEDGWPIIQLVADAKYRIDATDQYRQQFKSFGPPTDAINVLHRYRDAILEIERNSSESFELKRSVVQAAALFPMNQSEHDDYRNSRLWESLERLGVGAIPVLPSNQAFLKEWLLKSLRQGGWSMADRAIANLVDEHARNWRIAASEPVLVGTLRSPGEHEHLDWVRAERRYYHPLAKTQRRQYSVKQVAIYIPAGFGEASGVRYVANVEHYEILDRVEIATPWTANRDERMILYHLGQVRAIDRPVDFVTGDYMPPQGRWTTRLGLERAGSINELALETEPEWRMLEWLRASRTGHSIRLAPARSQASDNPKGRAWFILDSGEKIRYDGANGFLCKSPDGREQYVSLRELIHRQPE
ncbi:MAG: restriction endonuclease-like protein [bacterium]|nr:restriction endonuclease-like protein [bacterium]